MSEDSKYVSEPERLATEGAPLAEDSKQRAFLLANIKKWLKSARYLAMRTGQEYYENRTDVLNRKRTIIGREGEMVEAPYLSNNRLPHAFMRKLTKQKVGYLLSKPFTLTSDNETFQENLTPYFTKAFYRLFKNGGQDAVVAGLGWLQVYYNEKGTLSFKRIPSTEVVPFWEDIDHTKLGAAIRVYSVVEYDGEEEKVSTRVQYFTKEGVYNYIMEDEELLPDTSSPVEYNFVAGTPAKSEGYMWDEIPLIPLKYNTEEDSLLKYIKELIDDYDLRTSDTSNAIEDEPDKIKVVKDYDGTDKGEFVYNLAKYRTLFLRGSGSVETLDTSINTSAIEDHLNRLRKDIYEFGGGVDTQNKDLGNASGVALKFVYSDLDMDCSDFGTELSWAVEKICWFIKQDLKLKGVGNFEEASVEVTFNTDIAINETETIENLAKSASMMSTHSLLAQHPYVNNVEEELSRLEDDYQREAARIEASIAAASGQEHNHVNPPVEE